MSHEAVTWALKKAPMLLTEKGKPDTTARHVLVVLAECAHADGSEARPSIMSIQHRTGYDRRTVQRALRRLQGAGLIIAEGSKYDCTIYRLPLRLERPATDWTDLEAEEERQRGSDAERQRRSRAKRVTHSDSVTVTDADSVTGRDVTHSNDVSHALSVPTSRTQNPDVTHATPPYPSFEPSGESSLSPSVVADPSATAATGEDEREIIAALPKDNGNDDPAKVAAAWTLARGRGRNPAAEQKVADSAALLLGVGWSIPDVISLAEDMARKYPTGTDLAVHEGHWVRPTTGRGSGMPDWCTRCNDGAEAARYNPKFRKTSDGALCGDCHPDVASTAA